MEEAGKLHTQNHQGKEKFFEFSLVRSENTGPDKPPAVLLLHGLTASPLEMKEFGEFLFSKGHDVFAPCLSGHGTSLEDLKRVSSQAWLRDCDQAFARVEALGYQDLFLAGQSFGAVLCMYLAAKYQTPCRWSCLISSSIAASPAGQRAAALAAVFPA